LEENKKDADVVVLESGLQYKIITQGTGAKPASAADTVKVNYRGTLIDGTVFDSSYDRGEPIQFPLNGVIKGWTEGLQLLNEGTKAILYIPSDLAYGEQGAGRDIGPNSTLIFEVELLEVKPAAQPAADKTSQPAAK
jgi:FKBP-type peptidyl-prolyl cis-trans isomerase